MFYSDELIDEIRQRCNIVDLVSGYVSLKKRGSNYFGLCPFHNEKSGSFSVNERMQLFYCFGCGVKGNVYTFLMKYENYTFPEAVRFLAQRVGVALPQDADDPQAERRANYRKRLLEANKEAAKYFYYALRDPRGEIGMNYFKERGLTDETMHHFGLGYATKNSNEIVGYLKSKGFSDKEIWDAGLADHSEKYGLNGKFWNRVMFPIQDINHRVIAFGGRVMGDGKPKYLNSPETDVFNKSKNLYGLNWARTSRQDHFILCEGYMDVIAMHQAGFTQAVAALGTAFTDQQAMLIKRYVKQVIMTPDSDGPGIKAALRNIEILRNAGIAVKVMNLLPYKDPDEFIKGKGAEAFAERMKEAENGFFFEIRILEGQFDLADPDGKTAFYNAIAEHLCSFEDEMQRENYLTAIAEKYQIKADMLRDKVRSAAVRLENQDKRYKKEKNEEEEIAAGRPKPLPGRTKSEEYRLEKIRRSSCLVLSYLADEPGLYAKLKEDISPADFEASGLEPMAVMLFEELEAGKTIEPAAFVSRFADEEQQSLAAAIFQAKEEAMGLRYDESERQKDPAIEEKAFKEALLFVKNTVYEKISATAPLEQLRECKRKTEELKKRSFLV